MKQVFILLVLACLSWQAGAQVSVKGTIRGGNQEVLAGAHVFLNKSRTTTDVNGVFSLTGLDPGNYNLTVSYIGYNSYETGLNLRKDTVIDVVLTESAVISEAVIISAVRASQNTPTTFSTLNRESISRQNSAQDMPYLLNLEPSVVTTSDAGAGVGYTGLRVRGSDITRINVTINGVPLNDPESHTVYWVDIPDFAGSVNSLQLQRGVGSSTNGAGAFGASMNLETNTFSQEPYGEIDLSAGSFNTWKTSFQAGTGLMKKHWYFEGRGSALGSDGYIDRASSDLSSYFFQGGYINDKTLIKAVVFGGKEKTYQSWYGIDAATMATDRTFNWAGAIFNDDGTISFYNNQTDNYNQKHYQLHVSHRLTNFIDLNVSGHFTKGSGYYEEYQQGDEFQKYGLGNLYFGKDSTFNGSNYDYFYHDTVTSTDLVRRRWLDNNYYGITWSLHYKKPKIDLILGGAANKYDKAKHYGEIIWARYAAEIPKDYEYYRNIAFKTDFNIFLKAAWKPVEPMTIYGDIQYRTIGYADHGIESHLNAVNIDQSFHFFNPKAGISYNLGFGILYASYSIAHREPIRDDYIDAFAGESPKPEMLGNLEVGLRRSETRLQYQVNYFLMNYRNQLVLTGEINDDGAFIRRNAGKSLRSGIEMAASWHATDFLNISGNLTLSVNRTDYKTPDSEGNLIEYKNTELSFSPSIVSGGQVQFFPFKNLEIDWMAKYVGKQYLDNTQNEALKLNAYFVNDARVSYFIFGNKIPDLEISILVNDLFNRKYESNGYVYDGYAYYYPQAGTNFISSLKIRF
ncbi:MAG TPA: TonB-dependent receptor [Bacteroidales bacterium]|nr:TonB-dependent receptor [Bacteroidales bacterium]